MLKMSRKKAKPIKNNILPFPSERNRLITKPRNTETSLSIATVQMSNDSFKDKGIWEGDYLVVNIGEKVSDGDIAVIKMNGHTTVKIVYFISNECVRLEVANEDYAYLIERLSRIEIIGRVFRIERDLQKQKKGALK